LRNGEINTYIEPFVGGGAVFFHIAQNYPIKHFYLFDINQDLIKCYLAVKHNVKSLIAELRRLENSFLAKSPPKRKEFYYRIRGEFNKDRSPAKLVFLNKTCYNGLYRVNRKDEFNVPFGGYKKPRICDAENLRNVSEILQNAEIICGDFEKSEKYINDHTFVYFDPPYDPISDTSSFTGYTLNGFDKKQQLKLKELCDDLNSIGCKFLLSNSATSYIMELYKNYIIEIVQVNRPINSDSTKRGKINEVLVRNYE
jgi:DNA adenine methylase